MPRTLLKRKATFDGILQRIAPQEPGERPSYMLINPAGAQPVKIKGEDHVAMDVPVVVQATHFGAEDLSGPVKVTVLIEQIEVGPKLVG